MHLIVSISSLRKLESDTEENTQFKEHLGFHKSIPTTEEEDHTLQLCLTTEDEECLITGEDDLAIIRGGPSEVKENTKYEGLKP